MSFRVQSKEFSLTFPKCPVPKEDLLNHLKQERNCIYICVAKELHEDGEPHLHAHIVYAKRKDIKNAKYFDIQGYHCNIQATESSEAWNKYVKEDGDFIEHGEREISFNLYEQARTGNHDEFFESARTNKICFQYAMEAWRTANQVDTTINEGDIIDGTFNQLLNWYKCDEPFKTNVIVGETGTGKPYLRKQSQLNLASSAVTWMTSSPSNLTSTSQSSLTICPFPIYQQQHKSIWSTNTKQDQYMCDTAWHEFLRELNAGSPATPSLFPNILQFEDE
jgi:Geminivirus Rep catalytic domain.